MSNDDTTHPRVIALRAIVSKLSESVDEHAKIYKEVVAAKNSTDPAQRKALADRLTKNMVSMMAQSHLIQCRFFDIIVTAHGEDETFRLLSGAVHEAHENESHEMGSLRDMMKGQDTANGSCNSGIRPPHLIREDARTRRTANHELGTRESDRNSTRSPRFGDSAYSARGKSYAARRGAPSPGGRFVKYLYLLALAACGAPFESAIEPHHEAGAPDETSTPHGEAGNEDSSETSPPHEAGDSSREAASPPHDAGHDAISPPKDAGCGTVTATFSCSEATDSTQYCILLNGGGYSTGSTPPECQCPGTYTCLCIETNAPSLNSLCTDPSYPNFNSCYTPATQTPVVDCY
jgi:hypothetical protein